MQNLRQNKKIKIAILLLCICVLAFFAFSFAYELREADHICLGPDCAICVQLHQLATLRSQLLSVFSFGSVFAYALLLCCGLAALYALFVRTATPVALKVKLNN